MGQLVPFPSGRRYNLAETDAALLGALRSAKVSLLTLYLDGDPKWFRQRFVTSPSTQCEWDYIADAFADICDCDPEDIQIEGTEFGDRVTMRGQIVGRIERRTA